MLRPSQKEARRRRQVEDEGGGGGGNQDQDIRNSMLGGEEELMRDEAGETLLLMRRIGENEEDTGSQEEFQTGEARGGQNHPQEVSSSFSHSREAGGSNIINTSSSKPK